MATCPREVPSPMTTSSRTVDINVTRCVLHPRCLHRQRLPLTGCVQLPNATALRAWVRLTWLDSSTAQSGWARMSTGTRPGGARIPLDGSVPAGAAQERLLQSPSRLPAELIPCTVDGQPQWPRAPQPPQARPASRLRSKRRTDACRKYRFTNSPLSPGHRGVARRCRPTRRAPPGAASRPTTLR